MMLMNELNEKTILDVCTGPRYTMTEGSGSVAQLDVVDDSTPKDGADPPLL